MDDVEIESVVKRIEKYKEKQGCYCVKIESANEINLNNELFVAEAYIFGNLNVIADNICAKDSSITKGKIYNNDFALVIRK
jgi:hypothetical protein